MRNHFDGLYHRAPATVLALVLFVTAQLCWAVDEPLRPSARASQLLKEAGQLGDLIAKSRNGERLAERALRQAEQALHLSREEQDNAAAAIAAEARSISQQALENARAKILSHEKRLREVEALLGRSGHTKEASRVLDVKGEVLVKTRLGYVKVGPNFELRRGEEIRTGRDGELTLQVDPNGSKILLHSNSAFVRAEKDESEFELSTGMLKAWVMLASSRRNPIRIKTASSAVAVRGTEFEVLATAQTTETRVYSGQVEVTPLAGGEPILVGEGQKVIVEKSGKISGPHPLNVSRRTDGVVFTAWAPL